MAQMQGLVILGSSRICTSILGTVLEAGTVLAADDRHEEIASLMKEGGNHLLV